MVIMDNVFWVDDVEIGKPLDQAIFADVVIVGGGMAGLSAAQAFHQRGCKVVLLERSFCGSGATGKSSGFVTPDSELPLHVLVEQHGPEKAKKLWEFALSGVKLIRSNLDSFGGIGDCLIQDTLVVASSRRAYRSSIEKEYDTRQELGYTSTLYDEANLSRVLGSSAYKGGISYGNTFAINGYRYCHMMKRALEEQGVKIYEGTHVTCVQDGLVETLSEESSGKVTAKHIIVCTDYVPCTLTMVDKTYPLQTYLLVSKPLSEKQCKALFPDRPCMVWDTDLIYHYYRLTRDNRLLVGGASLWDTYAGYENHNNVHSEQRLLNYIQKVFPGFDIEFEYGWPGLLGVSKDLFPIAGQDREMSSVYYACAAAGLPWAAAIGRYSAEAVLEGKSSFDSFVSPYRKFPIGQGVAKILGRKISFALSHLLTVGSL